MNTEFDKKDSAGETIVDFKKVLRGFDPDEVRAYIGEMNRMMQDVSKNYELRMAEMKQELTLVNRERDTLRERCAELESRTSAEPAAEKKEEPVKAGSDRDEISALKKDLKKERDAGRTAEKALQNAEKEIEALTAKLKENEQQLSDCRRLIDEQEKQNRKQEPVRDKYEESLRQIENLKSELSELREKRELLEAESAATGEHLGKIENENSEIKTELSRLNVENSLLKEKNEQYKKELSELKTDAKAKAYSYAEKLSAGEEELNREKLKLQKKLQLQNYHIEQAETAIEELKKQLEQMRITFGE